MKIIYGITKSNFGGAQRYVFDLAVGAKLAGHDVVVICGGKGVLVNKLKQENIRVITIPGFGRDTDFLHDAPRLWFILKNIYKEKPDVLHINSAKMGGAGIFSGRLLGIKKIIFTGHGWAFNEPRPLWQKILIKFFTWMTILRAHKTICVSEASRSQVSNWPLIKNKLVVVHNGIEKFDLIPRDEARKILTPNLNDSELLVGTNSELHRIKGLDILLEAWGEFKKNNSGTLIIMGDGEEKQSLQNMAQQLGISDSVIFKGYVDNARSFLLGLDIFTLTSRSENLPYAILEAGMAKLPVVASSVGGIPEIIKGDLSGILVEKEKPNALQSALETLSKNKAGREIMGNELYKTVTDKFSKEKMMSETFSLY